MSRAGLRGLWPIAFVVAASAAGGVGLFVVAVPALYARQGAPDPEVVVGLDQLGLSTSAYAGYWTGLLIAFALLCATVAAVVVWRRPREPMAWLVALFLVLVGTVNAPTVDALAWRSPGLTGVASTANLALTACMLAVLLTFPDGRSSPRWAPIWGGVAVAVLVATGWGSLGDDLPDVWYMTLALAVLGGLAAQVHRYRRVSAWEQRQQTKWVVAAAAIAILCQVVFPVVAALPILVAPGWQALLGDLLGVTGVTVGYGVLVAAIGVAVMRHRLWDVDIIVNRTLVYGGLTVGVLALYAAVAVGFDQVLGSPGDVGGSVVTAAAVALVFGPCRDRLQRGVNRLLYGQRDEPYDVLSELTRQLRSTMSPDSVLQTIAATVAQALRLPYAALTLDDDQPLVAVGTAVDGLVRIPLVHHNETVGALMVAPRSPNEPFSPADRALLEDLAHHAAVAAAEVRLSDELQQAREQRVLALEEERRRLRRDLHDGLGPALASMALHAELAHDLLESQPDQSSQLLTDLTRQLQASTADIRRLVYDLRPPALDDLGLEGALRAFLADAGSSGVRIRFAVGCVPTLSAAVEVAAYRIVQEAVTNVVRHAHASTCRVEIRFDDDAVVVEVIDDGIGLPAAVRSGVGLRSMRERAAELGGSCTVAAEDEGTRVRVHLPHAALAEGPT